MLVELSIKDFAIIEKLNVNFNKGMTVLTGETGAGKSIIIDAVGLLAGGRGSVDFVRKGTNKAVLQGVFDTSKNSKIGSLLAEFDIPTDDFLIITRELFKSGRSVCRVNGVILTLNNLKRIGHTLIDIHGQNEHQELMDSEKHIDLLDQYDYKVVDQVKKNYQKLYDEYRKISKKYNQTKNNEHEFNQRLDMLKFQLDEIKSVNLKAGEDEELEQRRDQLSNYQDILTALSNSIQILDGEDESSTISQVNNVSSELEGIANFDSEYQELSDETQNAYYALEDVANRIRQVIDTLEWNPQELNEVESRLEIIRQLKKKYGDSIDDILEYEAKISQEYNEMSLNNDDVDDLQKKSEEAYQKVLDAGEKLHDVRQNLSVKLQKAIQHQLSELYMDKTKFEVVFNKKEKMDNKGLYDVEFYIQPNPGEDLKPLAKIASGGELSRIMLALKTIFAKNDGVTSIIFDEVDTGVSGRVAQAIADKIHQISTYSQVLCISHLPQVAARADNQLHVEKQIKDNRTRTSIKSLNLDERIMEIARMLAGVDVTDLSRQHAKELLDLEHNRVN